MAFLMKPDINIIKNVCQQKVFKESGSKELVCFCVHFGINLHHIQGENTESLHEAACFSPLYAADCHKKKEKEG